MFYQRYIVNEALDDYSPLQVPADEQQPAPFSWSWRGPLMLGATLLLIAALFLIPSDLVEQLGSYGYLGVFLLTLLSSATVVLPSPALGVVLWAGQTLNPWLVGLVSGVAAGLGETTGYLAGLGGSELAERSRFYPRVKGWVQRWGLLTIFVLAFVPGPMFDLAGIAAGTVRMPFRRFLLVCMAGKVLRMILVAWAGRYLGDMWSLLEVSR
jgi:membrane protein DedA with SNARE-associated domain